MDFPIILNPSSKTPLWKQLSGALAEAILQGRLRPGDNLLPSRVLGQMLGISRDTVVRAYDELATQGYVEGSTRAGTKVRHAPLLEFKPADNRKAIESPPSIAKHPTQLSRYAERLVQIQTAGATSFDQPELNFGAPPAEHLPGRQWREIFGRHAILQDMSRLAYDAELFGHRPLREAIAAYLRRSKAIN